MDFLIVEVGVDDLGVSVVDVVGVAVPDDAVGVLDSKGLSIADRAAVISVVVEGVPVGAVPPRRGESRCNVDDGGKARSARVLDGERWRPAWSSRTSGGREVEADRKLRTSEMVFEGLTFRGIAGD